MTHFVEMAIWQPTYNSWKCELILGELTTFNSGNWGEQDTFSS